MALSGSVSTNAYEGRYYILDWSASQSITNNQSTLSWELHAKGKSGEWYAERTLYAVLAGQVLVNKVVRVQRYDGLVASGSFTVGHAADGTYGFTGSVQAAVFVSGVNCTGEASFELNQIPRQANITGAPNFNDEENPTITYSNPAGNSVTSLEACISLTGALDDISYRMIPKTGSSYTFQLTDEERKVLRNATLNGSNSRTVKFYVRTKIGSSTFHSIASRTFTVINASPTIEPTVKDVNEKTLALTGDENVLVRFQSIAKVEMTATAKKHATIKNMRISNGQQVIDKGSGEFLGPESEETVFRVTDSRGNETTERIGRTLIPYVKLTCDLVMENPDVNGNVNIQVKGNCFTGSFGTSENAVAVFYKWKEDEGSYCDWIPIGNVEVDQDGYNVQVEVTGLNYTKRYVFQAKVVDLLGEEPSVEKMVKTTTVFDWGKEDFNFNCDVKILGRSIFDLIYPVGSVYMSAKDMNPAKLFGVGEWEQIQDRFLVSAGEQFEVESTGGKSIYNLRAAIGAVDANPSSIGYIAANHSALQRSEKPTYVITSNFFSGANSYWNHSTPVTDENGNGTRSTEILPPYMAVYMWKRVA